MIISTISQTTKGENLTKKKHEKMACCSPMCQRYLIFTSAILLVIIGTILVCLWNTIFQAILKSQLNVGSKSTLEFSMFKDTPIPMYIEFYLFNWTNSDDVIRSNWRIKPKLEQCGPYTYYEHHTREQIVFNQNHTITFKTKRTWQFLPDKTNGTLQDKITTINPIVACIGHVVQHKHKIIDLALNFILKEKNVQLNITKTAAEWLFDGYDDPLLDLLHKLNMSAINVPFKKFGWFVERNNSVDYDGIYTMKDGTEDIRDLGRLTLWNGANHTDDYSNYCGMVNGTIGEIFYPVKNDPTIDIFASDTCSTLQLEYQRIQTKYGIEGRRYVGTERLFDNGTKYPEMACFSPGELSPSGVRNVSQCKFNSPAFVSFPHFYLADPSYVEPFEGLSPDESFGEFYIVIEPETGIPLSVQAAMQISMKLSRVPNLTILSQVKEIYFPLLWFRQSAELSEELATEAKLLLVLPTVGVSIGYGLLSLGCLLFLIGGFIVYRKGWKGTDGEELINQDSY